MNKRGEFRKKELWCCITGGITKWFCSIIWVHVKELLLRVPKADVSSVSLLSEEISGFN